MLRLKLPLPSLQCFLPLDAQPASLALTAKPAAAPPRQLGHAHLRDVFFGNTSSLILFTLSLSERPRATRANTPVHPAESHGASSRWHKRKLHFPVAGKELIVRSRDLASGTLLG